MTEPFIGQITMTAFDYAPRGFALCDGALLPIAQNQALYSLIGTTYGGDGQTNFALPNLQGRVPIHRGNGHEPGESGGVAAAALSDSQTPGHTHELRATNEEASTQAAGGALLAASRSPLYREPESPVEMASATVGEAGQSQAHENMQPYTAIGYCIALQGVFPSRN